MTFEMSGGIPLFTEYRLTVRFRRFTADLETGCPAATNVNTVLETGRDGICAHARSDAAMSVVKRVLGTTVYRRKETDPDSPRGPVTARAAPAGKKEHRRAPHERLYSRRRRRDRRGLK